MSACLLVLLYALAGQRPVTRDRSESSTKIVAASVVFRRASEAISILKSQKFSPDTRVN